MQRILKSVADVLERLVTLANREIPQRDGPPSLLEKIGCLVLFALVVALHIVVMVLL
jgi:hypothetical protein